MKERIIGLDILRILSMLGIVMLHVLGQGGVLNASQTGGGINFYLNNFLEIIFMCSVDVFALLSGFLCIEKKKSSFRTIELIFIVLFYCIIITIAFVVFFGDKLNGIKDIVKGLFPPLVNRYWYITCFLPILLLEPIINKCLNSLSIKQYRIAVVSLLILFSLIPSLLNIDFFKMENGYSFVWLLTCYIIGGYMRKSNLNIKKRFAFVIIIVLPILLLFGNILIDFLRYGHHSYMVTYTSPLILFVALAFLMLFKNFKTNCNAKVIKLLSVISFDVYIIHCHVLIYDIFLKDAFAFITKYNVFLQPLIAICIGIIIYMVCSIIGLIRMLIFEKFKINRLMQIISEKITVFDNIE